VHHYCKLSPKEGEKTDSSSQPQASNPAKATHMFADFIVREKYCSLTKKNTAYKTNEQDCAILVPYFFCQPTVFFSHNKLVNSTFSSYLFRPANKLTCEPVTSACSKCPEEQFICTIIRAT